MHPYLTRLGICPQVQEFFEPFCTSDSSGNISFSYSGLQLEIYGMAFHRIPVDEGCWIAGSENRSMIREVIISSSAMEAIAWLNCNFHAFRTLDNYLFISTGVSLNGKKLNGIRNLVSGKKCRLLFGNDLLGRICDLKMAAAIVGYPVSVTLMGTVLKISFRNRVYEIEIEAFSLNSFGRLSSYRFSTHTSKPKQHVNWLSQLEDQSLKK